MRTAQPKEAHSAALQNAGLEYTCGIEPKAFPARWLAWCVMTQGEHLHDALTGQHLTFLQSGRDTAGELLQLEVRLDPGGWVPHHVHARQDERVEALAGTLTMRVGGKERRLGVGDVAHVHRRKVHVVRNAGADEARFLLEVRPARRMEGFMRGLFTVMKPLRPLARLRPPKGRA